MEPAKRLGSEAESKTWLDTAAQVYAQRVGISLSTGGSGSSAGGSSREAVMNSEEFLKFQVRSLHVASPSRTMPILISLSLVKSQPEISEEQKNHIKALY